MSTDIEEEDEGLLTIDQLQRVVPKRLKSMISQKTIDTFNNIVMDDEFRENYRDNILSYTKVLEEGRFKIGNYLDAVRYCSFKLMGCNNIEAYTKTFPDRYQKHLQNGTSQKDIASYVTSYNKNKLVNLIMEQAMVPMHVLNLDYYQKAINVSADLMMNASSEKVRCDAANNLMTQLKAPETKKIELDIGVKQGSVIEDLMNASMGLAEQQRLRISSGVETALSIAHSTIIEMKEEDT
ncbi:MAG: hypothetical protein HRU18_02840 [Pseudoalteromonas sp.]|uniref:hypothetical protein n=1 Tax=Pseudoalteromonas sp. TaxID=53249 RepID=UPI001DDE9939|nr:hypothetical protein [Pseudoalteromonas sp.]NRA77121.1 hypothetical protein [Pseudoalteromonas sp.]